MKVRKYIATKGWREFEISDQFNAKFSEWLDQKGFRIPDTMIPEGLNCTTELLLVSNEAMAGLVKEFLLKN